MIATPGALISTQLPQFEKYAFASAIVVAPTVIAVGALAGDALHASILSLPAAATTVIPELVSLRIASFNEADALPPILKLTTACDLEFVFSGERIQSRPAITEEYDPRPVQSRMRTGTTVAFFAIPYFVPAAVVAT